MSVVIWTIIYIHILTNERLPPLAVPPSLGPRGASRCSVTSGESGAEPGVLGGGRGVRVCGRDAVRKVRAPGGILLPLACPSQKSTTPAFTK